MPKRSKIKTEKAETFNWKGIRDNKDGTFDVADKHAKNRLQREFRRQGIRTRSQKIGTKGFIVYPVGQRKQRAHRIGSLPKKERQYYPGTKPNTRVRGVPGPRPQLRQGRPGFRPRPSFGGRPSFPAGPRKGTGIPQAIMKSAEKRAQKLQEQQRSPYTPDGKPRPGYQTYVDKTGTQRIVKMPTGGWRDRFASRSTKEGWRHARVTESRKVEAEMAARSTGPSTRIPERDFSSETAESMRRRRLKTYLEGSEKKYRGTTQLPRQHPADTEEGGRRTITSSGVRKTSELPEHKPDYQKMQHERAEAMERFSKIKLGENEH